MAHDADQMKTPDLPADNRQALRQVARSCRKAVLSTLAADDGSPYGSLVTVAFDLDLSPILLLSGLADHTRNLMTAPACSLLLDGTDGHPNPQTGPRVTLCGRAERVDEPRLRARFLVRHPGAALYADFGDFSLWRIIPTRTHFVGGFGRAVWFDAPFGLAPTQIAQLAAAEAVLLENANARWGERLGDGWRIASLDPDGADLSNGQEFRRLIFHSPIDGPERVQTALAESLNHASG